MSFQETNASPRSSDEPVKEGFSPVGGMVYGVLAFVGTFVLTTGYFIYRIYGVAGTELDLEDVFPEPSFVGFPFYNSHRVDTPIAFSPGSGFGSGTVVDGYFELFNQFAGAGAPEFNPLVFNAIPAGILFLTGYVIASRASSLSIEGSAAAGASVAVGYLPLFVLGTFVFSVEDQTIVAGPELGLGLLFFGALFTIGFGGLGGYVRGRRGSDN